jgi:hypothetical protein
MVSHLVEPLRGLGMTPRPMREKKMPKGVRPEVIELCEISHCSNKCPIMMNAVFWKIS